MSSQTLMRKLQALVSDAIKRYYPELADIQSVLDAEYTTTSVRNFGDIQLKGLIGAAKSRNIDPSEVAQRVGEEISNAEFVSKVVPEKVGYINVHIKPSWICKQFEKLLDYDNCMKSLVFQRNKVVAIDYSSPNLSKELHAGHLRSTVVGDSIVRVLEYAGCKVHRINFVGDWGTQFGMIIRYMIENPEVPCKVLSDMDKIYVLAKKRFDSDPQFADASRQTIVAIQKGDPDLRKKWRDIVEISVEHIQSLYDVLGAKLKKDDIKGESMFNDDLAPLIEELDKKGILIDDEGAKIVLTPCVSHHFKGRPVCIMQKRDGGFCYATTDVASLIYRLNELKVDVALYVVDARQETHLAQVFYIVQKAGYYTEGVEVKHVKFGMILGSDQKPFKSRTGGNIKLMSIIDDVIENACKTAREKNALRTDDTRLSEEQIQKIGRSIAISAIKYADLSKNRTRDYVLNLDAIVSFEGNTAPYIMYAYTRSFSVARRTGIKDLKPESLKKLKMTVIDELTPQEHALSVAIIQFPEVITQVSFEYTPHLLCAHIFRVANLFARFYETSNIAKCNDENRDFRIILTVLTAKTLELGMNLLGMEALEVM